jgi:hypothetical protein
MAVIRGNIFSKGGKERISPGDGEIQDDFVATVRANGGSSPVNCS